MIALILLLFCNLYNPAAACRPESRVVLGDERFEEYLPLLSGKRVAIFSNQTGIVGDRVKGCKLADALRESGGTFPVGSRRGKAKRYDALSLIPFTEPALPGGTIEYGLHLLDVLLEKGVQVTAIFSPEHGFRGDADAGEEVSSSVDARTGVAILSLYEQESRIPGPERMERFDVLLVDIQDVGLRFYTYYVSMFHLMEACARYGKPVIVLDRPNPNGFYVDGPILDMRYKSGVGWLPIPTVHGMTLGELALMINGEGWLGKPQADGEGAGTETGQAAGVPLTCDLTVIPCLNYSHQTRYSLILPPSPNLKDMRSVYLYASTCYFEGTVVSLGRGTPFPFEVYGHPEMRGYSFSFTPASVPGAKYPPLLGQECFGVDLRSKPLEQIWSDQMTFAYVIDAYHNLNVGDAFFGKNRHFELLAGVSWVREMIAAGASSSEIRARWAADVARFKEQRRPYLLYKE